MIMPFANTLEDTTMAKAPKPLEELNVTAQKAVQQTTEQTLSVMDNYFNFLQQTISSLPTGGTDLGGH